MRSSFSNWRWRWPGLWLWSRRLWNLRPGRAHREAAQREDAARRALVYAEHARKLRREQETEDRAVAGALRAMTPTATERGRVKVYLKAKEAVQTEDPAGWLDR